MKKKAIVFIVILNLILLAALNCGKKGSTDENEDSFRIPVQVMKVERKTISREVKYTGDIHAEQQVKVFSKIPDRILKFYKDEGDYVAKGDVIAVIEATKIEQAVVQARAAVLSARAQLVNLEAEYNRAKRLHQENAMSQQQFDAVAAKYEATKALMKQSEAALAQAESQLADAKVTAPISGIIGTRNYEQGDMATGPLPLVTIVQMNRVKVEINAPEQDLGQLKIGQHATLTVRSYPGETFTGTIQKISPVLDPVTRMGKIEIIVDNKDRRLKPGMFAEVEICVQTLPDVLVVPKFAVIENTELKRINGEDVAVVNSQVFVEKDGIAYLRDIEISYTNGEVAVVSSGVEEGENIVVVGQQSLKDGAKVKIVEQGVD